MMKKLSVLFLFIFICSFSRSDEGMLIPSLLSAFESDMQSKGMKLSAEDIYNVNQASIKDAIFHFGGGCTSSVISNEGLLITNYHCGYSQIYSHSTLDNNIANNGFWAKSHKEELPNSGLTATRMVAIEDVTRQVLEGTQGMSNEEMQQQIMINIARIKAEATENSRFDAEIKPFDFGNSYFLLIKETFRDIRLVGAPPKTVGKFGGDTDNWMWPRHTGDFALFRIYSNTSNQPADYSTDNVPYTPIHFLPVSIKPHTKDEFAMVFGFPGRTYQHTISTELDFIINKLRSAQIQMRELSLSVIDPAIKKSEKTELNYASKQSRIANAYKKWKGQVIGLKEVEAVNQKITYEDNFIATARKRPVWANTYGNSVSALRKLSSTYNSVEFTYKMFIEYNYVGAEVFKRARSINKLMELYNQGKKEELKEVLAKQKKSMDNFYDKYNKAIDKEVFKLQSKYYKSLIDSSYLPSALQKQKIENLTNTIYEKSFLVEREEYRKVLNSFEKYAKKKIDKDPGFELYKELDYIFNHKLLEQLRTYYGMKKQLMKQYVKGQTKMFPDQKHWFNANGTLRLSYGNIGGVEPRDGIKYTSHTTLKGVIEKYNTGEDEYTIPSRILKLYNEKDYGEYTQDGELPVCFLSNNHTTGGNSGSPVLNGEGYFIGLNFDRTWESTMSDFVFDGSRCRNISVDARYILWLIDKFGEAKYLVDEMTLVR